MNATPAQIAEARFFFLWCSDFVKYWHCGGILSDWKCDDDPWVAHATWYPTSQTVLQEKGAYFIFSLVRIHPNQQACTPNMFYYWSVISISRRLIVHYLCYNLWEWNKETWKEETVHQHHTIGFTVVSCSCFVMLWGHVFSNSLWMGKIVKFGFRYFVVVKDTYSQPLHQTVAGLMRNVKVGCIF